jgi:Glycosyl transferase family group 2
MRTLLNDAIIVAWLSSSLWLAMMLLAFLLHLVRRHPHDTTAPAKAKKLIIQITTIGDDIIADTVRRLRAALNGRDESLFEIWVVTEPSDPRSYPFVDQALVVPPDFQTSQHTKFKGRAHEYARLYRVHSGLTNYKVLYMDDDSTISPAFIGECYNRSFDLLQGPVVIGHPRGILSHLDASMRAVSCLSLCSFFQELSHQLFTHGEGFCIDEGVDRAVSWDYPGWYADDLVYGAVATRKMGFRMRSTYATVQTNSPISIRQFIKQRRRWFWASAKSSYLLPLSARLELWGFAILGLVITPLALLGIALAALGIFHLPAGLTVVSQVLFGLWILAWSYSGYFSQRKVRGIAVGAVSAMIAPIVGFVSGLVGILMGPVQTFEVMRRVEVHG